MTTFFEHQRASYKRNYLRNLICMASSDGNLDDEEKVLIQKIGVKRGLKEWQVNQLIDDPGNCEIFLPESINNRMSLLYDLMQIIHVDSQVSDREVEFMVSIIGAFKLHPEIFEQLMQLFRENVPSPAEWKEFVEFVYERVKDNR